MNTYTIIDSDDYAAAGIETLTFKGGEPHAKCMESLKGNVLLVLKMRNPEQILLGACVKNMLAHNKRLTDLRVFTPYFPGARQDRYDGLSPYTLGIMSQLLETRGSVPVSVFDIHSKQGTGEVLPEYNFMPSDLLVTVELGIVGIIAPDAGAEGRALAFRNHFYPHAELVQCTKTRNSATGGLFGYHMPRLQHAGGYIIVDDICDGGATFNLLAQQFRQDPLGGNSWLHLFVSHGIFSKGVDTISSSIKRITTTDSWFGPQHPDFRNDRVQVLKLNQLYQRIMT